MQTGLGVMEETGRKQVPWTSSTPGKKYYLAGGSAVVQEPDQSQTQTSKGALRISTSPRGADI